MRYRVGRAVGVAALHVDEGPGAGAYLVHQLLAEGATLGAGGAGTLQHGSIGSGAGLCGHGA